MKIIDSRFEYDIDSIYINSKLISNLKLTRATLRLQEP